MHDKKYSRSAGLTESGIRSARSRYPGLDCITLAERAHRRNPGNAIAGPPNLSDDTSRASPWIGLGAVRLCDCAPRQSCTRVGVRERSRSRSSRGGRVLAQPPWNRPAIRCGVDPPRARAGGVIDDIAYATVGRAGCSERFVAELRAIRQRGPNPAATREARRWINTLRRPDCLGGHRRSSRRCPSTGRPVLAARRRRPTRRGE